MPNYDYTVLRRGDKGRYYTRARVVGRTKMFTGDTARDVHAKVAAARTDAERGVYIDPADRHVTLREFGEYVRAHHVCGDGTAELIRNSLHKHWYPLLGDVQLVKLRPSRVQQALATLVPRLAASTLREQTVPHLRLVLRRAVDDRIIVSDPSSRLRLPRVERREMRIPTPAEVERLLEVIDARYRALIAVGAGLGLRQGEAFGLSRDRVDFLRREVKIDRQLKRTATGSALGQLKTERSRRAIPLPDAVAVELAAHLERFPNKDPEGLLFVAPQNGRLRRDGWNRRVLKPAVAAAGIDWLTFHHLRHFYASALIRANHAAAIVAARMGNTAQMVHETYAHLWPGDDDRTRQAIDDVFAEAGTEAVEEGR